MLAREVLQVVEQLWSPVGQLHSDSGKMKMALLCLGHQATIVRRLRCCQTKNQGGLIVKNRSQEES